MSRSAGLGTGIREFLPSNAWYSGISSDSLKRDAIAGVTNATLVVPQAIAFSAIAGLPPEYGFYTAMVVPIVAALFGSSWQMVSGPTTAISAVIFVTLSPLYQPGEPIYIQAAVTLTLLVGIIQVGFRLLRLGQLVTFVSHSVVVGFTAGAAVLIGLSQLKHGLGIDLPHASDLGTFSVALFDSILDINLFATGFCVAAFGLALAIRRYVPRAPNYLISLAIVSLAAFVIPGAATVAFVAPIASVIPTFSVPGIAESDIRKLMPGAFAIALIGVLEAISVSRALTLKSGQHIDSNREIYGQGLSNVVGAFFSAYASSGSFTRSALNQESGALTPLSSVFAAVSLLLIMIVLAPVIVHIPIPAMAGLIMLVAWRLIDFKHIVEIFRTSRTETVVLATTFLSSIAVSLEFAIYSGVIVSLLLYLRTTMRTTLVALAPDPWAKYRTFAPVNRNGLMECPQVMMTRMQGPLYFGATDSLRHAFERIEEEQPDQKHLFIRIEASSGIDLAGVHALSEENSRRLSRGGGLYVSCGFEPIRNEMKRLHLPRLLGPGHVFRRKEHFIAHVVPKLDKDICATCRARIFHECPPAGGNSKTEPMQPKIRSVPVALKQDVAR